MDPKALDLTKGRIIERPIFTSLITSDGRNAKHSQADRNALLFTLFKNTSAERLGAGIPVPLKRGHDDPTPDAKGYLLDINRDEKRARDGSRYYGLRAKMFVFNDLADEIEDGKFPAVSVELKEGGFRDNGSEYGPFIKAVAFCGTDPVALPSLYNYAESDADPAQYVLQERVVKDPLTIEQINGRLKESDYGKKLFGEGMADKLAMAQKILKMVPEDQLEATIKLLETLVQATGASGGGSESTTTTTTDDSGAGLMDGGSGGGGEEKPPGELSEAETEKEKEYRERLDRLEKAAAADRAERAQTEAALRFSEMGLPDTLKADFVKNYTDRNYGPKYCETHYAAFRVPEGLDRDYMSDDGGGDADPEKSRELRKKQALSTFEAKAKRAGFSPGSIAMAARGGLFREGGNTAKPKRRIIDETGIER